MDSSVYSITNIGLALQVLKEKIAPELWSETALPVIAAPAWWMEQIRVELGAAEGMEPDMIHNCKVIRNDDIDQPVLVDHDGKVYPIIPAWQRAKAEDTEGGDAA